MPIGEEAMKARRAEALSAITRSILDPGKELIDLVPQANALRDLLEQHAEFRIDPKRGIADGETRLDSGLAISPTQAAMCAREQFRTLAFIRGLAAAIADTPQQERPVRVLYAGCGPYALLAIPLMTQFAPEQLGFTLLDIHQGCLDSALSLIDRFGLSGHVDDSVCADATRYRIPPDRAPDIILTETMSVCLRNEPQVSIARHLLGQAPQARLVPESIQVELALLNPGKEHVLCPHDHQGEIPLANRDRISLGNLFELNAASMRAWENLSGDRLPARQARIPRDVPQRYSPFLLTRIDVYATQRLRDYDSSLTIPQPLRARPPLVGGETLQFHYALGPHPGLRYEIM